MTDLSPNSYETALSHIIAGVVALESHPPLSDTDLERVEAYLMRLDRTAAKSAAALRTKEGDW